MIEEILPPDVAVAEALNDDVGTDALFPAEASALGRPVEKRRREFITARACARRAMAQLGLVPAPVPSGPQGEPIWPAGIVGSITHCVGYRACAVARASDVVAIGIDAEPHAPLPAGIRLSDIAGPEEVAQERDLRLARPSVHWDRLLFSAKEAVYKAWFPQTQQLLGFEDAHISFKSSDRTFTALVHAPSNVAGTCRSTSYHGRWLMRNGLVMTAVTVIHDRRTGLCGPESAETGERSAAISG